MAVIGFILSPLSWWNDLLVNIPLAYGFALLFGFISKSLFWPALIIGYWLTNVIGFLLMHHGLRHVMTKAKERNFKKEVWNSTLISLGYTAIIIIAIKLGWLKFLPDYFNSL